MATKSKIRTTIELKPGDKEGLQEIARALGFLQSTGNDAGSVGSISALMQAIANKDVKVTKSGIGYYE